jgi:hypothetical protein
VELKRWLEGNGELIGRRWWGEIRRREDRRGEHGDGLLSGFLNHLVSFLPACLGESRQEAEEVWQSATHLYGSLALRRGLASGEVVEEIQLLREVILRLLMESPLNEENQTALPRELLALNRVLDQGVVQASIAYVDDLFFAHLQGSGVPEGVTSEVVEETTRALEGFRRDLATADPVDWSPHDRS